MHANLHRHHRVCTGGDSGSLLLLISVPGSIAYAAGDERDGHNAGNHQVAALGRHFTMTNLGFVRRGNGRQGNIAHGDGLVHGRRRAQAGKLAGQRIFGRQAVEQDGFLARVGFGLIAGLAFVLFGFVRSVFGVAAFVLSVFVRLVLRVDGRIAKRELV